MWWRSPIFALAAFAAMAGLGLAGCGFQPLYGSNTTTASGARLSEAMASIDVQPIPGRVGQKLRNELIFSNTGGGYAPEYRYQLRIAIRERVISQLVQISGDARGQVYRLEASFKLIDTSNGQIIHQGSTARPIPCPRASRRKSRPISQALLERRAARLA